MVSDANRVIAARWIFPVTTEPIEGGWIRIDNDKIVDINDGPAPAGTIDLGNVAILPGLVNAHTHLEFSDLREPIGQPGIALPDWIGMVIRQRAERSITDRADVITDGMRQSLEFGVSLIGEIATPPVEYLMQPSKPELVTFAEVLGLSENRSEDRWRSATEHHRRYAHAGWSPHAPYSTTREMIRRCAQQSGESGRPLAMHVAESPAERELLTDGIGSFANSLKAMGVWREGLFPWGPDPLHSLIDLLAQSSHALLVHGNDLRADEIERLVTHANMTVVYCPRTHAFFDYPPHPVARCLAAGVRVALGTDSRASNPDLNLWAEVQHLLNHRGDILPADVLAMATVNGADALQRPTMGRIEIGSLARLGVVSTEAVTVDGVYEDFAQKAYRRV